MRPACLQNLWLWTSVMPGCISSSGMHHNNDESKYREEVEHLMQWCRKNNLCINVKKTKEIVMDFRRDKRPLLPLYIGRAPVEVVSTYRYLAVVGCITTMMWFSGSPLFLDSRWHNKLRYRHILTC
ncbi:uncharacterized protein FYW61_003791 isoform 1-T1 [Anableps anableps]